MMRMIVTRVVSRIGTARTRMGRKSVATVVPAAFQLAERPSAASEKPSSWLPESPMKIAAGLPGRRLKGRKPAQASPTASARTSTSRLSCVVEPSMAKYAQAIAAIVAARPSMLSRRLKAFVIPTSQRTAIAVARTSLETICTCRPATTTSAAPATWLASLATGGSARRSSVRPAAKTIAQPPRMPKSSFVGSRASRASAAPTPATRPAKSPIPPRSGVCRSCQRSPRGSATTRRPSGERISAQVASAEAGSAKVASAAVIRGSKGRPSLLASDDLVPFLH
jgi:hypothetical protein